MQLPWSGNLRPLHTLCKPRHLQTRYGLLKFRMQTHHCFRSLICMGTAQK